MNIYFNSPSNIRNRDIRLISLINISILSLRFLFLLLLSNLVCFLVVKTCFLLVVKSSMSSKSRISPTLAFHYSAVASSAFSVAFSVAFSSAKSNFVPRALLAALIIAIILVMSFGSPKAKSLPKSDNSMLVTRV